MHQRLEIGRRLKDLRKKNKYSQSYVAQTLFISQAAYSLIENAQNGLVADHIIVLSNLYKVPTDYILKGDQLFNTTTSSQGFIPYYKIKAHAGNVKNLSGPLDEIEKDWYRIPGLNQSNDHRLFGVEGKSMTPNILPEDVLICQVERDLNKISDGSLVILVTQDSLLVKRVRLGNEPNYILFENDNPEEGEVLKLNKEEIKEIQVVRGKITNISTSPPLIVDTKLLSLEKSVELLKKELSKVTKKLKI